MANTYHQIYLQTVFAVKYPNAVIDKKWRSQLFDVIENLINEGNCKTIIVNGVGDHVHWFFGLKPVVLSYDIVRAHGGEITAESKVGEGSEFVFSLPIEIIK